VVLSYLPLFLTLDGRHVTLTVGAIQHKEFILSSKNCIHLDYLAKLHTLLVMVEYKQVLTNIQFPASDITII
jgi:hypothetical protein